MAYYDEPLVDPTADFETQQAILDQQAARVKALRARADKGYTPNLNEVGGYTLSTGQRIPGRILSPGWGDLAGAIAPLVAGYRADKQEGAMNKEQAAMRQRMQADAIDQMSSMPQDQPAVPGIAPLTPNDDEGNPMPIPQVAQAAKPVDRGTVLAKATAMMRNPLLKATGTQYLADQLIKEPERIEARAERVQSKADAIAEARRKQADDIAFRREQAQQHDATLRAIAASRASGGGGHNMTYMGPDPEDPTKGLWADPRNPSAPPVRSEISKTTPEKPAKNLPAGEASKFSANEATMASIDSIVNNKNNDEATGLVKGTVMKMFPVLGTKAVNEWWSKAGDADRRNAINRLSAIEVHRLYGASQTIGEIARAGGFMPEPTDDAATIASKLSQMKASIRRENDAIDAMAASQGYKSPRGGGGGAKPPAAPADNKPMPEPRVGDVVDGYRRVRPGDVNDPANWEPVK